MGMPTLWRQGDQRGGELARIVASDGRRVGAGSPTGRRSKYRPVLLAGTAGTGGTLTSHAHRATRHFPISARFMLPQPASRGALEPNYLSLLGNPTMLNAQEVRGQWDKLRGKVKEKWGQLTDDDLMIVGGNVDELVGRIHEKTGVARETVEHFIADLASRSSSTLNQARDAAMHFAEDASGRMREGAQRMRAGYEQVSDQMRDRYEQVNERVRENPGQSMLAVFGLGVVTGVALGLMLRSSSSDS